MIKSSMEAGECIVPRRLLADLAGTFSRIRIAREARESGAALREGKPPVFRPRRFPGKPSGQ